MNNIIFYPTTSFSNRRSFFFNATQKKVLGVSLIFFLWFPFHSQAQCPGTCNTTITSASNLTLALTITNQVCFDASGGDILYTGSINLRPGGNITICGGSNTVYLNGTFTEGNNGSRSMTVNGNLVVNDADLVANFTKTDITVNGNMTVNGQGSPTTAGITGGSLTVNTGGTVNFSATAVNFAATYTISGTLNVTGDLTTSSGSNFTNTGAVNVSGNASFSGIYNNHGVWTIGQQLSLSASAGSDLTGGRFYSYDLILNSATITASAGGCAAFIVTNNSNVGSAGLNASGAIGIWDMSNPGSIDNVNTTCAAGDPAPWDGGPYCGVIPISSLSSGGACFSTLPVEWLHYSAQQINPNQIKIEWSTASEQNNDFFTLQRSYDGLTFIDLDKISGAGTSYNSKNYSFTDNFSYSGVVFYRIKQTDYDGKSHYSDVMAVSCSNHHAFHFDIFPNPTTTDQSIHLITEGVSEQGEVLVVLMDQMGGTLYRKIYITEQNQILIGSGSEMNLPKGLYFITASSNNSVVTQKLLIN